MSSTTGRESPPAPPQDDAPGGVTDAQRGASYASGARILTVGIASTGIFTFAYLAAASHALDKASYSRISLCWAIMFVILSVIYRPIEQLLSRTIADRRARGLRGQSLRVPAAIQIGFASVFLIIAIVMRDQIQNGMFDGSSALYWILVVGVVAYGASYFARGWLAGQERFALYGGLVFLESTSRFLFALAVVVGAGSGQDIVGLGMAVAPFASLTVLPFALTRMRIRGGAQIAVADAAGEGPAHAGFEEAATDHLSLRHGTRFAVAVVGIMLSEQALMNAGVLIVAANAGAGGLTDGITGFVFNVMLIVRAPLQLFQAVQTSILPHLAGLEARESGDEFHRAIRITILAIAGFGLAVALGLLLDRAAGDDGFPGQQGVHLRPLRTGPGRPRDGAAPDLGHAQSGGPGPRPGDVGGRGVADRRGSVRRLRRRLGDRQRGHPRRGRILRRHRGAVRAAGGGLSDGCRRRCRGHPPPLAELRDKRLLQGHWDSRA